MTYYIHPIWFYLMDVCDWFKGIACVVLVISIIALIVEVVSWFADYTNEWGDYIFGEDIKQIPKYLKLIKRGFIITIITIIVSLILAIGVPTSKTITKMLVASVITVENVESAKEDTKELVDYICEKISEVKNE